LPEDEKIKLVFIAGGIGITPFRSMIKYLLDKNIKREIILFYMNKTLSEIIYKDIFDRAESQLGIKVVYILTDRANLPKDWKGETGKVDEETIRRTVSDYRERKFYLSGPHEMIQSFEKILDRMGVKRKMIKTDYFPGYA